MSVSPSLTKLVPAPLDEIALADRIVAEVETGLRVAGARPVEGNPTFPVFDPATSEQIAEVADASPSEGVAAIDVASRAGESWARTSLRQRADILDNAYQLLEQRRDEFAHVITREMGKPLGEAYGEVTYGGDFIRWFADEAIRPRGDFRASPAGDSRLLISRGPVGLALLITPWNFPLAMATRKIAPAVAAGCAVILKPSDLTPLTSLMLADVFRDAGVPDGVVNVLTTTDAAGFSAAVMKDVRVRKVSFTGSTPVGRILLAQAAQNVQRTSLELGGNAPFVVFDDADVERAVEGAMVAKLRNGGQSCIAANRFLVQSGIAGEFAQAFAERMAAVSVGHGLADGVTLGPVIDRRAVEKTVALVADAVDRGAEVLTGAYEIEESGSFVAPTVLDRVPLEANILATEVFSPVASISRFETESEAIERANDTSFGLASYIFTEQLDRAFDVAEKMQCGMIGINQGVVSNVAAPFGGVKQSGIGREGGGEGIEEYQDIRYFAMQRRRRA